MHVDVSLPIIICYLPSLLLYYDIVLSIYIQATLFISAISAPRHEMTRKWAIYIFQLSGT